MTACVLRVALTLSILVAPFVAEAQQPGRVPRIGILQNTVALSTYTDTTWKVSCNLLNLRKQFAEEFFRDIFVSH